MNKLIIIAAICLFLTGCGQRDLLIAESMANIKAAAQAGLDGAPSELTYPAIMRTADAVAHQLGYKINIHEGVNND